MKLTHALLKGFKRFNNSRIAELEAEFNSPVQIIVGSNGAGKSAFLRELSPLPSTRTDYDQKGLKELHLTHEGHSYILKTDFTNRVSPHSFVMDGVELNTGHTSDVQEELSVKHFQFTPAIRNLVYGKTQMCSMTPAARKEMFLNINPMDLSLILNVHKLAMNKFRDCKANLKMLYTRKGNLEAQMLKPETLAQHVATKEKLSKEILEIDKVIYALEQHIHSLNDRFRDDLNYKQQCLENNQQLIPSEQILHTCKEYIRKSPIFSSVARGDEFITERENLHIKREQLRATKEEITKRIESLSADIDDYTKHLNQNNHARSIPELQKEIKEITSIIDSYKNLPSNPIPEGLLELYSAKISTIKELVLAFQDADVKLEPIETLISKIQRCEHLKDEVIRINNKISEYTNSISSMTTEISDHKSRAKIPDTCTSHTCGLKVLFDSRIKVIEERLASSKIELKVESDKLINLNLELKSLAEYIDPFVKFHLVEKFNTLLSNLNNDYFKIRDWNSSLVDEINIAPLKIIKDLTDLIEGSKAFSECQKLKSKRSNLQTELDTILKSEGASEDFLKTKINEKQAEIKQFISRLKSVDQLSIVTGAQCALYAEYEHSCRVAQDMQNLCEKGERALLVSKALEYWKRLGKCFVEAKKSISEELRQIETIVRDQEVLKRSYESETLTLIDSISKSSIVHEHIVDALSPNSGIPYKSMVKYLNAMINNVNYFLSQLWTFKLALRNVTLDKPLDYKFPIEIGTELSSDINHLSDGQTEALNLMWVLSILLQMKILNKIPFFGDELGRTMDQVHRQHLLDFLNQLIDSKLIDQLFLINHYAALSNGFTDSDIIVLDNTNLAEMPPEVNRNCRIIRY